MKIVLRILGGLAVLVLLLVVVAFFFPRQYRVERSVLIQAPAETVFAHVGDLRAWKNWTAWHERDAEMKVSYSEKTTGANAWSAWESKSEGYGKMTFDTWDPAKKVVYRLEFPDFGMISSGMVELQPASGGVRTVWVSEGDLGMNPVNRWFGLFLDGMIGRDFEKGLAKLKTVCENAAKSST